MTVLLAPPRRERRAPQACVAIRSHVTMDELGTRLPPLSPELERWLADRGLAPSGPAFFRYRLIDMAATLTVDVGFPVATPVVGDGRVLADELPGGVYVVARHRGHPAGLQQATAELLGWAEREGVAWDREPADRGEAWRSRLEWYLDEPGQPMAEWVAELAFLTR